MMVSTTRHVSRFISVTEALYWFVFSPLSLVFTRCKATDRRNARGGGNHVQNESLGRAGVVSNGISRRRPLPAQKGPAHAACKLLPLCTAGAPGSGWQTDRYRDRTCGAARHRF